MNLVLRALNEHDENAFLEGLKAFEDMDLEWYTFLWKPGVSFKNLLIVQEEQMKGINLPSGHVPSVMLYAFVDSKIVGRSSIRHELNDYLLKYGGHIGYAVASSYRKKGYATEILAQSLKYCRESLGLEKVLVTCDDDNIASVKAIEKNHGVLENKIQVAHKSIETRRYWINL